MLRSIFFIVILLPLIGLFSCKGKHAPGTKTQLTVSIVPQKYLVEMIAGDKFDVQEMLPPGSNHETYEPTPRDMEKVSISRLYLALGALDFEITWLDRLKASNPDMQVINTGDGISMLNGHFHHQETESTYQRHGLDPHTWLSPSCMKIQAVNICHALSALDPATSATFTDNLRHFNLVVDSVDRIIRTKLAGMERKPGLIFHPALAYFARDYQLEQISIEQDGKEPSPAYMAELIRMAREKGIKAIFISKEFDTRNAEAIAREINGKVVVFDPMAADWATNMIHLADLISQN